MSYSRTAAGEAEVVARALPLSVPARRALNAVTKGTTIETVRAALPFAEVERVLRDLIDRGLVVADETSSASATSSNPAPSPDASAAPPLVVTDFALVRRTVSRFVIDHLGPDGESLAIQAERARDATTLEQVALDARRVLQQVRGRSVAETFTRDVLDPGFGAGR